MTPFRKILRSRPVVFVVESVFFSRAEWGRLTTPLFWAAASGAALCLAFSPVELGWVAWAGMAPFLLHLQHRGPKEGAWLGFAFGIPFFYLNLTWLNELSAYNPFAPVGVAFLALVCALAPLLFGALSCVVLSRPAVWRFIFLPALWTAVEYARCWTELAFPWFYLGHTQVNNLALIQICDLTGVAGLSFLIVLVNLVLAETYRGVVRRHVSRKRLFLAWAFAAAAVGFSLFYGRLRLAEESAADGGASGEPAFRIALIQPGVPQRKKLDSYLIYDDESLQRAARIQNKMNRDIADTIQEIRLEAGKTSASQPNLYILPESAVTHPRFNLRDDLRTMVRNWSVAAGAPILFGANRIVGAPGAAANEHRFYDEGKAFNSAYLARPETGVDAGNAYDKMHLVPFGEYSSYFGVIPGFTRYILGIADFTPGAGPRIFEVEGKRFGVLICFESCFAYLFRKYEALDPDCMVIVTNDAWYGLSSGARRHQILSVFRAVETRRPVVRAANTGISCVIDPWGRTVARLDLREGEAAHLVTTIPPRPEKFRRGRTLYMAWGEWFNWLCLFVCGIILLRIAIENRRNTETRETS